MRAESIKNQQPQLGARPFPDKFTPAVCANTRCGQINVCQITIYNSIICTRALARSLGLKAIASFWGANGRRAKRVMHDYLRAQQLIIQQQQQTHAAAVCCTDGYKGERAAREKAHATGLPADGGALKRNQSYNARLLMAQRDHLGWCGFNKIIIPTHRQRSSNTTATHCQFCQAFL